MGAVELVPGPSRRGLKLDVQRAQSCELGRSLCDGDQAVDLRCTEDLLLEHLMDGRLPVHPHEVPARWRAVVEDGLAEACHRTAVGV